MQFLDAATALLALLSLGVFYIRRGLCAALAPLAALSTAVLFLTLCGIAGLLLPGAFVFTAVALALGILALVKGGRQAAAPLRSVGFLFFALVGLLALVLLGLRQPVLSQWDEFSFWGTAVKMMKLNGGLYTTAPAGWFWTSTELPALPVLGWYMQFLGGAFAPWKVYLGQDLLLLACFAALAAPFEKKPVLSASLLAAGLALPFFFQSPQRVAGLSPAYLSAYGDLPAGILFGGALVFYLGLRRQGKNPLWALLPLGALALVKDNAFPLALVAGGLLLADSFFFYKAGEGPHARLAKAGQLAAFLAAPLAAYVVWKLHAAWANAQNPATRGAATGESAFFAAGKSLAQLVGLQPQSESFASAKAGMLSAFADPGYTPVSMLGSGLFTLLLILLLLLAAVLLARGRAARLRLGLWAGVSALGFLGFQFVLLTYFAFLNKYGGGLPDYPRYSATYFAGWLLLALYLLAETALEPAPPVPEAGTQPRSARGLAAQSLTLLLAAGLLALSARTVLPGYSVLDYPESFYAPQKAEEAAVQKLAQAIPPGSRVFYLNPGDDGGGWFRNHYYLQPSILDYSFGGDLSRPRLASGEMGTKPLTLGELKDYLKEADCRFILVDGLDEATARRYGGLFAGGLDDPAGGPALYERNAAGQYEAVAAA